MATYEYSVRRSTYTALALVLPMTTAVTLMGVAAAHPAHATVTQNAVANASFAPQVLPISGAEIQNPSRGLYRWLGQETAPQPAPAYDTYDRDAISWRDLEPTEGQYNLNILDTKAQEAKNRGGKYSFRIATVWNGVLVPDYLKNGMAHGWWSGGMYVPDWNDNLYLSRVEALWRAIGARFGNDPRFDHLDIGMYGLYGEWHIYGLADPSSSGASRITATNARRLIDAQVNAMPNKHWVMLWGNDDIADAVRYAMSKRLPGGPIGIRNDCIGASQMDAMTGAAAWPSMVDRWKTAPVVTEVCNIDPSGYSWTAGSFATVLRQTRDFHVSMIGNGNTTAGFSSFSGAEQYNWLLSGKTAGYRYELRNVTLPSTIAPGAAFTIGSNWANSGVAPTYDSWNVNYTLKSASGALAWRGTSTAKLRNILPTGAGVSPVNDNFTMPTTVAGGQYSLSVSVTDPTGYYKPLKLATAGLQADGSYSLGNVSIGGTAVTPPVAPPVTPPATSHAIRISAGGAAFTDSSGNAWQADTDYSAGAGGTYNVSSAITGTTMPGLYQKERWGMDGYAVPVTNGTYQVRLHFAEINPDSGTRVFSVTAEGQPWLTDFNIAAKVGNDAADVETKSITVSDGTLNLDFSASSNSAKISGLEIIPPAAPTATPIAVRYAALGGATSVLGTLVGGEYAVPGGVAQNYTRGRMYYSATTGAHEVHGAILSDYLAVGGPASTLRLPVTDETWTPDGIGRYNHFSGAGSVYWTSATGAHAVYGDIRARWAQLGWERSALGYPTTDEYSVTGGRRNNFQHGYVTWTAATRAITVTQQ